MTAGAGSAQCWKLSKVAASPILGLLDSPAASGDDAGRITTMEFHEFPTIYSVLKQHGGVEQTADQFYSRSIAMLKIEAERHPSHALAVEHNRSMCEWDWLAAESPYFKVYPTMIPLLSGVGIEVPVDYLRLPFQALVIRLPTEGNSMIIDDQYQVRAILVCDGQPVDTEERRVYLWIDVGERGMGNAPVLTYCQLECVPGIQIEEAFNRLPPERNIPGVCVSRELQARCLRLVVSVCFLATGGDRLVEPDVLSKDLAAYIDAQRRNDRQRCSRSWKGLPAGGRRVGTSASTSVFGR